MKNQIKIKAAFAILYFICFVGLLGCGMYTIARLGAEYESSRMVIDEQQAKEKAYNDVVQIVATTEDDRDTLAGFFITEKDTINFITNIENYARRQNLLLETTQLAVEPRKEKTEKTEASEPMLKIGFIFKGSEMSVKNMVLFFETLPLHKTIPELNIIKVSDTEWEGRIALQVTISS